MKKIIGILFFFLALAAVMFVAFYSNIQKTSGLKKITTFEQCAKAGYPVMQSYPRQCTLPGGQFFVERFIPEK